MGKTLTLWFPSQRFGSAEPALVFPEIARIATHTSKLDVTLGYFDIAALPLLRVRRCEKVAVVVPHG